MDNSKYYNDSLAYDFERFMPRKPKEENNIVKMPRQKSRSRKATRRLSSTAALLFAATFMLAALCGNIFLRLEINEVTTQINDAKDTINELNSEATALQVEVDRRISYCNIEEEAAKLGMVKRSKEQIKYIRVNDKNAALIDAELVIADE